MGPRRVRPAPEEGGRGEGGELVWHAETVDDDIVLMPAPSAHDCALNRMSLASLHCDELPHYVCALSGQGLMLLGISRCKRAAAVASVMAMEPQHVSGIVLQNSFSWACIA